MQYGSCNTVYTMFTIPKKKNPSKKSNKSDSEDEGSEHELFYYANDRIKLMKEVLKLLKPKKIKAMAPDCLKNLDTEELNSMLLEELLGISKKRLKKIFEGQNNDDESSSESDEDPIDIISLDDITDDDDIGVVEIIDHDQNAKNKRHKHKKHHPKKIKIEKDVDIKTEKDSQENVQIYNRQKKVEKEKKSKKTAEGESEKLLSVLELLELQARARAIKSQLIIEAENKQKAALEKEKANATKKSQVRKETDKGNESEDDAVIIDAPKDEEIIIPLSDSEDDTCSKKHQKEIEKTRMNYDESNVIDVDKDDNERCSEKQKQPKFRIIRNRLITSSQNLEGLTITVTNDKVKDAITDKEVKTETLANVSEFIGPSHGPIEIIHLDTLDVDLNEIILPAKDASNKEMIPEEYANKVSSQSAKESPQECELINDTNISESALNSSNNCCSKELSNDKEKHKCDEKIENVQKKETENNEMTEEIDEDDDVLLLDAIVDD